MARRPRPSTRIDLVAFRLERLANAYRYRTIPIENKPGVVAFLQPMEGSRPYGRPRWSSLRHDGSTLRSATVRQGDREYKLVQYCGGRWEIYRVTDGLETFLGYDSDVLPQLLSGAYSRLEPEQREALRMGRPL